jgi:hypothetical protein
MLKRKSERARPANWTATAVRPIVCCGLIAGFAATAHAQAEPPTALERRGDQASVDPNRPGGPSSTPPTSQDTKKTKSEKPEAALEQHLELDEPTLRPHALVDNLLLSRKGSDLVAHRLHYDARRGARLEAAWNARFGSLLSSKHALAVTPKHIYALSKTGLFIIDAQNGNVLHTRTIDGPRSVLAAGGHVYVSHQHGVSRFDASGKNLSSETKGISGVLRGADADLVLLSRMHKKKPRLTVLDLKTGKKKYDFRLLPKGDHRVAHFGDGRLSFIDFHAKTAKAGPKLFFTEADYRKGKRLSDLSLAKHYADPAAQAFGLLQRAGKLYLSSPNTSAETISTVFALDIKSSKILWKRGSKKRFGQLVLFKSWLVTTLQGKSSRLIAHRLDSGKVVAKLTLDSKPRLVLAGKNVLVVATEKGVRVFAAPRPKAPAVAWRAYEDRRAGYTIKFPRSWRLVARRVKHFGPQSFAVPFVKYRVDQGRWRFEGSVHVLVRPARGQTVDSLWRAVLEQRQRLTRAPVNVQKSSKTKLDNKHLAIVGVYSFRNRFGKVVQARSLCAVTDGLAIELRARAGPNAKTDQLWPEVMRVFDTFRLRPELRKTAETR